MRLGGEGLVERSLHMNEEALKMSTKVCARVCVCVCACARVCVCVCVCVYP